MWPLDQRRLDRLGDLGREHGLAGAGLALDQKRPLERDRGVDRDLEVGLGDVVLGSFETHAGSLSRRAPYGLARIAARRRKRRVSPGKTCPRRSFPAGAAVSRIAKCKLIQSVSEAAALAHGLRSKV